MKILVVQPHLDDAFFSLTETAMTWVEDGHEVLLSTVFGGVPPATNERRKKHVVMWEEYERAIVRGPFLHLAAGLLLDDATRGDQLMLDDIKAFVQRQVDDCDPDVVVMPQGIHHPDHVAVGHAEPSLKRASRWYYDELPYFAMYPELSGPTLRNGRYFVREGSRAHLEEKKRICRLFASQMGETEERCLWVPERVWRPR